MTKFQSLVLRLLLLIAENVVIMRQHEKRTSKEVSDYLDSKFLDLEEEAVHAMEGDDD